MVLGSSGGERALAFTVHPWSGKMHASGTRYLSGSVIGRRPSGRGLCLPHAELRLRARVQTGQCRVSGLRDPSDLPAVPPLRPRDRRLSARGRPAPARPTCPDREPAQGPPCPRRPASARVEPGWQRSGKPSSGFESSTGFEPPTGLERSTGLKPFTDFERHTRPESTPGHERPGHEPPDDEFAGGPPAARSGNGQRGSAPPEPSRPALGQPNAVEPGLGRSARLLTANLARPMR